MFCIPLGLEPRASKAARGPGCLLIGGAIARGISLLPEEAALILARVGRGQREVPPEPRLSRPLPGSPAAGSGARKVRLPGRLKQTLAGEDTEGQLSETSQNKSSKDPQNKGNEHKGRHPD